MEDHNYTQEDDIRLWLGAMRSVAAAAAAVAGWAAERRRWPGRAVETSACTTLWDICASRAHDVAADPSRRRRRLGCRSRRRAAAATQRSEDWPRRSRPTSTAGSPEHSRPTSYTVKKYPYIHGHFAASFPHFNGTCSVYAFVSANRRNNEARAHTDVRIFLQCR